MRGREEERKEERGKERKAGRVRREEKISEHMTINFKSSKNNTNSPEIKLTMKQ